MPEPETMIFKPSDWVPNHPCLPVVIYRSAIEGDDSAKAAAFETRFLQAGWQDIWQDGIYPNQHYHSGAHEVLGIARGHARLLIGGPNGVIIDVGAGDCLVLPAGTGHMRLESGSDFLVVGAYPPGQTADILTEAADEEQLERIRSLPLPATDPLSGRDGPLLRLWSLR